MGLRLLPGEKEELRLHPAPWSQAHRQLWAVAFLLLGGLLWWAFHAPWWPNGWGASVVPYLWTAGGLLAGGLLAALPGRSHARFWAAAAAALLACAATALWLPQAPQDALPVLVMLAALPALAWVEARRLGTTYHVTSLRLVVRTTLPRRTEAAVLFSDLADLDVRASAWPDTGTLIPVPAAKDRPAPPRLVGVRPLSRVRRLVELLAQRATLPEAVRGERNLDRGVAEALAALHRR